MRSFAATAVFHIRPAHRSQHFIRASAFQFPDVLSTPAATFIALAPVTISRGVGPNRQSSISSKTSLEPSPIAASFPRSFSEFRIEAAEHCRDFRHELLGYL